MGEAIGQVVSLGVGVAISPVPIIAVVLMLGTPRGRVNGPAFIAGWLAGLAAAGVIVLFVAGGAGADDDGGSLTWVAVLKLVLGAALLLLAARQWKNHSRSSHPPPPSRQRKSLQTQAFQRWRDPDSNRGHHDFQSCALPTELSRRGPEG